MNEKLFRTQFNQMETTEKQALMESLAARYDILPSEWPSATVPAPDTI